MSFGVVLSNQTIEINVTTSSSTSTTSTLLTTIMDESSSKPEEIPQDDSLNYVFVPLAVFIAVIILSAMVYLMARNKRTTITTLYKRIKRPSEYTALDASDLEQDDNEDDPNECLLAGKLEIENRYDSYPIHSYINTSQRELYT